MITDSYRLSPSERARRIWNHLCLYCGETNHVIRSCPVRPPRPAVSTVRLTPSVSNIPHILANLVFNCTLFPIHVLVDSGAAGNFISSKCLMDFNIPAVESDTFYQITTIQGTPLGDGRIDHCTVELELILNGNHSEALTLLVLPRATVDVILGRPWLTRHSPHIDWRTGEILEWSDACKEKCLVPSPTSETATTSLTIQSTSVESPETTSSVTIPTKYSSYVDVFSKEQATHLPLHKRWDCSIDLLPGVRLPQGKVYPLSFPEREAMQNYIQEGLKQGFIRPSTSPAAPSFFFVAKKDGGLRPCIDYRVLNESTVKFVYSLPLVPAALEELREAKVFTKLDLRSAYNLIRIREGDEWKTAFITPSGHYEYRVMPYGLVNSPSIFQNFMNEIFRDFLHHFVIVYIDDILIYSHDLQEHRRHVLQVLQRLREHRLYLKLEKCEFHQSSVSFSGYVISGDGVRMEQNKVVSQWKEPQTIKELQRFLGFANFYRRFIKNFSLFATPLTSMLKGSKKTLQWNSNARKAFQRLKQAFTSAPMLQHPDPNKPFVVEVDAADTGVGAVLSQWSGEPLALHPCAYYSKKLTPVEQNYGIGDRELLAIKQALEEWRHWLEGAKHPFQVITDHKKLQYLQNAKRLNARQARWSMFFTYQPKHKNLKADALSRLHSTDPVDESPEPILPPSVFLAPIIWQLDDQIRHATFEEAAPAGRTYVPTHLRLPLLYSAHTSLGSGHPGSRRTLSLLRQRYWWPKMAKEVARYVKGCLVCAVTATPRRETPKRETPTTSDSPPTLDTHWGGLRHGSSIVNWTNGQSERKIQEISRYLRTYCSQHQDTWSQYLPWAEYAQNSLRQETTGLTPFQCVLGYQPPLFPWSGETSEFPAVNHWFRESKRVWDSAHVHLQRAVRRHTENANVHRLPTPTNQPGDKVWLSTRDIRLRLPSKKLSPHYIGPFTIHSQINAVTYRLNLPPQYRISSSFHVSLLKLYVDPVLPPPAESEPLPPPLQPEVIGDQIYRIHPAPGAGVIDSNI
ncbi:hypothetical protein M9458_053450 [Cirrhinus mrigala]|uniref:Gypsy retrotransposon integrase-like protein 1 n=1 Tax=Cirrhinus mrigala TaxID=683832 RepID=A0ABD0MME1_CIRMR